MTMGLTYDEYPHLYVLMSDLSLAFSRGKQPSLWPLDQIEWENAYGEYQRWVIEQCRQGIERRILSKLEAPFPNFLLAGVPVVIAEECRSGVDQPPTTSG